MDLNPNSLAAAARRIARYRPRTVQANVLEPWPFEPASFDSVGMSHLLHCVPGAMPQKAVAFEHAHAALAPGGVLFGATILSEGVRHTPWSRLALRAINRGGDMSNLEDRLGDLEAGLRNVFGECEVEVVGTIALFSARRRD
jgi:SAM-dependent methyltransferase